MPRVKRTRLRRSGIRKMFRNFSSMVGYPLWASSPIRKGVFLSYGISGFSIDYEDQREQRCEGAHRGELSALSPSAFSFPQPRHDACGLRENKLRDES